MIKLQLSVIVIPFIVLLVPVSALCQDQSNDGDENMNKLDLLVDNERLEEAKMINDLGLHSYENHDYDNALKNFLGAADLDPKNYIYLANAAYAYRKLAKLDESVKLFKKAVVAAMALKAHDKINNYHNNILDIVGDIPQWAIDMKHRALRSPKSPLISKALEKMEDLAEKAEKYSQRGQYQRSISQLTEALDISTMNFGGNHPYTSNTLNNLAVYYEFGGQFLKAEEMYKSALLNNTTVLGSNHPDTIANMHNLAGIYKKQGRYREAQSLFEDSLRLSKTSLGKHHPRTITILNSIGLNLLALGRYEDAIVFINVTLNSSTLLLGAFHPKTIRSMTNLGGVYFSLGLYTKAQALFEEVLRNRKVILGDNHPDTINSIHNLAGIYTYQGLYSKAQPLLEEAFQKRREILGNRHPLTISSIESLAGNYFNRGLYADAQPLLEESLKARKDVLGEKHSDTIRSMQQLALLYQVQGQLLKAKTLHEHALELSKATLGDGHPATLDSMLNMAGFYLLQRSYSEARNMFEKAYQVSTTTLGLEHPRTLLTMNNLAVTYESMDLIDEAKSLYDNVLSQSRKSLGENHPDTLLTMNNLAGIYMEQGDFIRAESLYEKSLNINKYTLGISHPNTLLVLNNLALLHQIQGNWDDASTFWRKSLRQSNRFLERVLWGANDETRQTYIEMDKIKKDNLLSFYYHTDSAEEAFYYSLTRKGLLLRISSEISATVRASQEPALRDIADKLTANRRELAERTLAGPGKEPPEAFHEITKQLQDEINKQEAELGRSVQQIRRARVEITPDQVVRALGAGEVLIDFLAYREVDLKAVKHKENKLVAVVVDPASDHTVKLVSLGALDPITQQIKRYRHEVTRPEPEVPASTSRLAKELYTLLWKPLRPFLKGKSRVFLVADGPLHLLPWASLTDDEGRYLAQTYSLVLLGSSRDLVVRTMGGASGKTTILSAPDYDFPNKAGSGPDDGQQDSQTGGDQMQNIYFNPLPGAVREGELIARLLRDRGKEFQHYTGIMATESMLLAVKRPRILHLATHGFFLDDLPARDGNGALVKRGIILVPFQDGISTAGNRPRPVGNPLVRSGLALTGANLGVHGIKQEDGSDGILTAMEVLSMDLTGTELVVLSACETGVGEVKQGEGVYGLLRAFQEAGANAVLSTLWSIDDAATQAFMERFYMLYLDGTPPQQSLRTVRLEFIADPRWSHPYYWAPFVMVGMD